MYYREILGLAREAYGPEIQVHVSNEGEHWIIANRVGGELLVQMEGSKLAVVELLAARVVAPVSAGLIEVVKSVFGERAEVQYNMMASMHHQFAIRAEGVTLLETASLKRAEAISLLILRVQKIKTLINRGNDGPIYRQQVADSTGSTLRPDEQPLEG